MLPRCRRTIASAPAVVNATTGHDALKSSANIGSVATITGNPQNMLVGSLSKIPYARFAAELTPVALVGLALASAVICFLFRRELALATPATGVVRIRPLHRRLMTKPLLVAALMLAGFFAGVDPPLVAAAGAAALLVTRRVKPEKVWPRIDSQGCNRRSPQLRLTLRSAAEQADSEYDRHLLEGRRENRVVIVKAIEYLANALRQLGHGLRIARRRVPIGLGEDHVHADGRDTIVRETFDELGQQCSRPRPLTVCA